MKRSVLSSCLLLGFGLLAAPSARGQDEIKYVDRTKKGEQTATGTITEESPSGIKYKSGTGAKEIASIDVIDVNYGLRAALALDYRKVKNAEASALALEGAKRKAALNDAIKNYQNFQPRMKEANNPNASRHIEYKIARLTARLAEDDPAQTDAAIAALEKYRKAHPDSWQIIHVVRTLGELQMAKEDYAAASKIYDDLAATKGLPKDIQLECESLSAEALIKAKRFNEAKVRFEKALKGLPADDPAAMRYKIKLAQCAGSKEEMTKSEKELDTIIKKLSEDNVADRNLKALAYNTLGDCYMAQNRHRDAFWQYLWVDVHYNQDRQEHIKAMQQLAKLFEEFKDETRAKQYKERLQKLK